MGVGEITVLFTPFQKRRELATQMFSSGGAEECCEEHRGPEEENNFRQRTTRAPTHRRSLEMDRESKNASDSECAAGRVPSW